jgi:MoaA/NifB/PqqE/SkfB family radical SAM enzyme
MKIDDQITSLYNITRNSESQDKICYAPIVSLRFAHTGNVQVCCFNRKHVLGNVANDTLHNLWFGEKIAEVRGALSKNDFSKGCTRCAKELVTGNYYGCAARNYDYLALASNSTYPAMLDFEIGNTCNYECIMCNGEYSSTIRINREKSAPYPIIYNQRFVDELDEFIPHLKEARFVGGEPFLVDIHYSIWNKIVELKPDTKITVLTNGSLFNHRIEALFNEANLNISFSIDSLRPEIYKEIRKRGDLDNVMKNFNRVFKLSRDLNRDVNLNVCLMRQNAMEMPAFVRFCNEREIPLIFHLVNYPFHSSLWNHSVDELLRIKDYYEKIFFDPTPTGISMDNVNRFKALMIQLESWINEKESQDRLRHFYQYKSVEYLQKAMIDKLEEHFTKSGDEEEIASSSERLMRVFEKLSSSQLHQALVEMLLVPTEVVAGEFINISDERLFQKLKFANNLNN